MTFAQTWISSPVLAPEPTGAPGGTGPVTASLDAAGRNLQVLDFYNAFRPAMVRVWLLPGQSSARLWQPDASRVDAMAPPVARAMRVRWQGGAGEIASLAAQPLHRLSAVARFDSSSPHEIAVRGNQEKMR